MTLLLSVSLKQMWNLLNVMQVLTYARNFTPWPPLVDKLLDVLVEALYLNALSTAALDFGKTKFEAA